MKHLSINETVDVNALLAGRPPNNFDVDMYYLQSHGLSLSSLITDQHLHYAPSKESFSPDLKRPFAALFHSKLAEYRRYRS